MPKRLRIAGTALLLVLIGLIVWEANRTKEPKYKGRPLSFWLDWRNCSVAESHEAINHFGTNCIPTLLRMLQAEDSETKRNFADFANHFITIKMPKAYDTRNEAIAGFHILGPRARGAVDALIKLYEKSPPDRRSTVAEAIGAIGRPAIDAIPTLLQAMTSTNGNVRQSAASALWQIDAEPKAVMPVMIKALTDPNESVRGIAVGCIADFGTNAASAVPALIATARDPDPSIRAAVLDALRWTGGEPILVVPALTNALTDSEYRVRRSAAVALGVYGSNSISTIPPLLLTLTAETNDSVRRSVIIALGEIHSRPDLTLLPLTKELSNTNSSIWANAALSLGNFGDDAKSAMPALIDLYHREQSQMPEDAPFKPQAMKVIRAALLKIDPVAAAQAGIKTNPPDL